ncbi:hypothetical protein [Cellulomonas sp. URHD0024]|uniref:hypothetical protein n=1 Tax=Cellulomonas sp. URHD0024 TaxID=1302620 RepID=UPI00041939A1|nr:hypothetical protein [Cellulomonas sp. URHD0024]
MTTPAQRVDRAVRLTPRDDRPRYEPEWRTDLAEAQAQGLDAHDVARGAVRLAVRLRMGQLGHVLVGRSGAGPALGLWGGLGALLVATSLIGGPFVVLSLVAVVAVVLILARTGTPSHWSHWLMVASVVVGVVAFGYVFWSVGAVVDAADDFRPEPAAAAYAGLGLVVMLLSAVGLIVSAVIAAHRERRTRP